MGGITLLQKLQKLYGARAVSDRLGKMTNVQTTAQGANNPFAGTFSKKYLGKNQDGIDEAHNVIMDNMQFAFGNQNPQQMKNFETNVNILFDMKFPPAAPAKAEAEILDLSTKKQVTGKGLDSLKKDLGLPQGVNKFTDLQAREYSANTESYRRPIIRQMLLKDTKIKLPDDVRKSLENKADLQRGADPKMDPLILLNEYYDVNFAKLDELEDIRFTARNETEAADEFLKKGGLEPKKDLGDKLKDLPDDIDPDAMAIGGRVGYRKGDLVTKGIPALIKKIKDKYGNKSITTADKIKQPQSALDRKMFEDFSKRTSSAKTVAPENKMTKTMINEGYDDPKYLDPNALDMYGKPITMDKAFFDKTREQIMKQINEQNRLMVPRSHGAYRDLQSSLRVSKDRLTALNITEEVGGNIKMFDKLRMKNGVKLDATPLSKFDYIKRTPAKKDDLSGIDNLFDKDGVLDKDAVLRDITKSIQKTKKSKIVKTKTPNKALLKAMDEVGGGASGDMKYDADILADEYAFQLGLIEEGGDVTDIVDQRKRMDLYNEAYSALSGQFLKNREKLKKMKQFSEPTETLKSIKDKGAIDISDPTIADEFTTFLKENDPESYKNLEQKIQLDNFDPKDRKGSAKGGLAGVLNI